jgi:hypothetical protein
VFLLSPRKDRQLESVLISMLNSNCAEVAALADGPRHESRTKLTVPVMVVPLVKGKLCLEKTFRAVTKEFALGGVSLVVHEPKTPDELILAFRCMRTIYYVEGQVRHLSPLGAGFFQLGVQFVRLVRTNEIPGLDNVWI